MKPDKDFIRRIMLDVVASKEPQLPKFTYPEMDKYAVNWHVNHLIECGFLRGVPLINKGSGLVEDVANISVDPLKGYAFVTALEDDTLWNHFKTWLVRAAASAVPTTASALWEYLQNYLKTI